MTQTVNKVKLLKSDIKQPIELSQLPIGCFKYCSSSWVEKTLKDFPETLQLIKELSEGFSHPRISYIYRKLKAAEQFGHGRMHKDAYGLEDEIHRLVTFNGTPTLGEDGTILYANNVWEFNGFYYHQARPADCDCDRLLLRVSLTEMPFRDRWEGRHRHT